MFVQTLPLRTNGTVSEPGGGAVSDDFKTTSLALAKGRVPPMTSSYPSIISTRSRNQLGKGIVSYKKYKPTSYYSYAMRFVNQGMTRLIYSYNPGGGRPLEWYSIARSLGYGYIGGNGTGMGDPASLVRWNSNNGDFRAVGNRTIIANLINRVNSEIMVKARKDKISLGESLADIDKTILMVSNTAIRLWYAFHHVRRGNVKKALEALNIFSLRDRRGRLVERATTLEGKWLALRYGWLPLVYDIYDGIELVNNSFKENPEHFTVTRKVKEWLPFFGHLWNLNNTPYIGVEIGYTSQVDVHQKYNLKVKDATMAYITSIGLENPLYVAWQTLPYSFVLDWMIPVSDWLSALTAPLGLSFVSGYRSIHVEHRSTWKIAGYRNAGGAGVANVQREGGIDSTLSFVELTREALTSFPTVQLYARLPSINPTRIADAIALIKERKPR